MALDIMGREIVDASAAADFQASLGAYSLTDRSPVDLPNMVAANQKVAALESAGALQAFPFFCYIADLQRHMCLTAPGEEWIILGGRLHGAQARVDRTCDPGVETEMHVNETGFLRQSVGFTRAPNGGVLIPETGLYRIHLGGRIEGVNTSATGRRYVRLKLNDDYLGGRTEFEGDPHYSLAFEWRFSKNDVIMPVGYQNVVQSGSTARRIISGTLGVYQSLTPSW